MNQLPVGLMAKGSLHGFATLYGIFLIGCLIIFGLSFLMPDSTIKTIITIISLVCFIGLCITGIILKCRNPETFSVREDYYITIKTEGSKTPDGNIITEGTVLSKPEKYPEIDKPTNEMGE